MNRLLLFLFGVLVGAAGIVVALDRGWMPSGWVPGVHRADGTNTRIPLPPPAADAGAWPAATANPPGPAPPPIDTRPPLDPLPSGTAQSPTMPVDSNGLASPATPPPAEAVALPSSLLVPVQGVSTAQLTDTFTQSRGAGRLHDAIDIMAPRGTPVLAVADGKVEKLFASKPGGLTLYQFDNERKLAFYYAHLERYAEDVVEGKAVHRGDVIGYVGSTGNANPAAPHLHFAVMVLGPEQRWYQGTAINPYPLLGGG